MDTHPVARFQNDVGALLSIIRTGLLAALLIFVCAHLNGGIEDIKLNMEKNKSERLANLIVLSNFTNMEQSCVTTNYSSHPEMTVRVCNQPITPSFNLTFFANNIHQITYNKCEASLLAAWIRACVIPPAFPVACGLEKLYGLYCTFPPSPIRDTRLCYKKNGQYDHFAINDGVRLTSVELANLVKAIPDTFL